MGKISRAATATTSNRSRDKKTTNKKTTGLTKQIATAANEALGKHRRNGIAEPNRKICKLGYKKLLLVFNKIKELEDECQFNIDTITERLSDNGDDGGNGLDDSLSNAKSGVDPGLMREKAHYQDRLAKLNGVKNKIIAGTFSDACQCKTANHKCNGRIDFERLLTLPLTTVCRDCSRKL